MKRNVKSIVARINEHKAWKDWFAWYPVYATTEDPLVESWVWLETVERRKVYGRMGSWDEFRIKPTDLGRRNNDT